MCLDALHATTQVHAQLVTEAGAYLLLLVLQKQRRRSVQLAPSEAQDADSARMTMSLSARCVSSLITRKSLITQKYVYLIGL